MQTRVRNVVILASLISLIGCSGPKPSSSDTGTGPTGSTSISDPAAADRTDVADDAAVVAAFEAMATDIVLNSDGQVTEVSFRGAEIDDSLLSYLSGLPRLQSLLLNDTAITDAGLKLVGKLTSLRNLDLRGCGVSNEGLAHLTELENLRALRLNGESGATTVDDDGLESVAKLTNLKAL
ncbi:MAG: hypothetical protein QGG09_10335, partial [Pirellulaceae bacterium]|nr:hypothetical protein [Pirellulaceae bacterium]